MKKLNKYNVWKSNINCEPIDGTDRILVGESKRWIMKHLAQEEGVDYNHNDMIVRCKDGTFWNATKI